MYYWRNKEKNRAALMAASKGCYIVDAITPSVSAMSPLIGLVVAYAQGHPGGFAFHGAADNVIKPGRPFSYPPEKIEKCKIAPEQIELGKTSEAAYKEVKAFMDERPFLIAYTDYAVTRIKMLYEENGDTLEPAGVLYVRDLMHDVFLHSPIPDFSMETAAEVFQVDKTVDKFFKENIILKKSAVMIELLTRLSRIIFLRKPPEDLEKVSVWGITYYPGFKGMQRTYINTNRGTFFYDHISDKILPKDLDGKEAQDLLMSIDLPAMMEDVFKLAKAESYADLRRFRGEAGYGKD